MATVLSKLLIGLLYSTRRYIVCLKTLLAEVVHPLKYFHTAIAIILYTYQYNQLIKRNTHLNLVHIIDIHLACTGVRYERKMHVLFIRK